MPNSKKAVFSEVFFHSVLYLDYAEKFYKEEVDCNRAFEWETQDLLPVDCWCYPLIWRILGIPTNYNSLKTGGLGCGW